MSTFTCQFSSFTRETVLLVEPKTAGSRLRCSLTEADYRVLSVNSRSEAIRLCRNYEGPIHLLVTDLDWDLVHAAKALRPGIIVVFLSEDVLSGRTPPKALTRNSPTHPSDSVSLEFLLKVAGILSHKKPESKVYN